MAYEQQATRLPRQLILTGASGWVGKNVLEMVSCGNRLDGSWAISAFGNGPGSVQLATGPRHVLAPIASIRRLKLEEGGLFIHAGFPTQDRVTTLGAEQYTAATDRLRRTVIRLVESSPPADIVYISSGAASRVAAGITVEQRTRIYGEAKLADEEALRTVASVTGSRLCIVRAFALSGRYMTKPETYALGNMISQARSTGRIEIHADRPVRRSYMGIADMVALAVGSFQEIGSGESLTFDTAGEVMEMGELAERILSALDRDPMRISRASLSPGAPPDDYLGDPGPVSHLAKRLLLSPQTLDEQIAETAHWLRLAGEVT